LHHYSIGYQLRTTVIDLTDKAFLQMNREHKQERDERNLKLQINMRLLNLIEGSSLELKGLVATGKQDEEQEPWFTTSDLGDTIATNDVCFTRKTTTQHPNPNESDGS
jgi:hypothetical protein